MSILKSKTASVFGYLLLDSYKEFVEIGNEIYKKAEKDPNFHLNFIGYDAIYMKGKDKTKNNDYEVEDWVRLREMKDQEGNRIENPKLIVNGIEAGDVAQGKCRDCWFLSALSVVAYSKQNLIENLIHPK
jgi:hypothetical protein